MGLINCPADFKFSVSMCVYINDNAAHFRESIESILNQTIKPDEVILVVDGPITPDLENVIKEYENGSFFKTIRLPKNVGHGEARRKGLENCSNDLVALMDADDISLPERFEKQINCFAHDPDLAIVGGNIEEFIESTNSVVGIRNVPQNDSEIKKYMKKRCPFNQVTVMFKKDCVIKAGGYIDWDYEEDYYLWIRMYESGAKFLNLNDTLVFVRVGKEMYKRRGGWKYFKSEALLQQYMLKKNIINKIEFIYNVSIRFILQVLMPNTVRGFIFKKFARKNPILKKKET
jgi:glycosyltransferase involved in cell wall biosynthesis